MNSNDDYFEEVSSWITESTDSTVQIKRDGKIIFTKSYNSKDIANFFKMKEEKSPIIFDEDDKTPGKVFSPYVIKEIKQSGNNFLITLEKSKTSKMAYFKRNTY